MLEHTEAILEQALLLSPKDRATLVGKLLASLDQPDPSVDVLWAKEAEDRISAYESGQLKAIPVEEVFKKYKKP
ncbi:MAG: addiction module protein [Candidatus Competibacteraceae bacterium]